MSKWCRCQLSAAEILQNGFEAHGLSNNYVDFVEVNFLHSVETQGNQAGFVPSVRAGYTCPHFPMLFMYTHFGRVVSKISKLESLEKRLSINLGTV